MSLDKRTKDIFSEESAKFHYSGCVNIQEISEQPCFSGNMSLLTTPKINLAYNPDYVDESKDLEKIVYKPFDQAFTALVLHELNHKGGGDYRGCPRDIKLHGDNVLEPMANVLIRLGFPNAPVTPFQGLYAYFANMFEDVVDNFEVGAKSDHFGMFLCYKDDAEHSIKKKFSPLFDAFVRLQQLFYGDKRATEILEEHYSEDPKVEEAIENFMDRSGLNKFRSSKGFDLGKTLDYCMDEKNWLRLSEVMAEEFSKLIDKDKLEDPDYLSETFIPLKGEDSFVDEMGDDETKMGFVWAKYNKYGTRPVFTPPAFVESYEALDLLYQRLARNLDIKTKKSKAGTSMPLIKYGKRPFDEKKDKLKDARVDFRDGELGLFVRKYQIDMPMEYFNKRRGLPGVRFMMMDTSGSMTLPVTGKKSKTMSPGNWTDDSRYHYALLAFYGLLELFKREGTLKRTSVRFANYSDVTMVAQDLRESKRIALTPQFGGTENLDIDRVRNMFGRGNLVISISDNMIANWNQIRDEYIAKAKMNHYFHLEIGKHDYPQRMAEDLKKAGLPVFYDDGSNLAKIVIDLTRPFVS